MFDNIIFLYAGQGSQFYQMGLDLYSKCLPFKTTFDRLESIVLAKYHFSIKEYLFNPGKKKSDLFSDLHYTHPGIFFFEYALTETLYAYNIYPDYLSGSSLGEITAITVAGGLALEDALDFIIQQCDIIQKSCPRGKMIAVLANASLYESDVLLQTHSTLVSINAASHFVISLEAECQAVVTRQLNKAKVLYQMLPVDWPFHSRGMDAAKERILNLYNAYPVQPLKYPLISGCSGIILYELPDKHGWKILRNPLNMNGCSNILKGLERPCCIDLSPMGTMYNILKSADFPRNRLFAISTVFGNELHNLDKIKELPTKTMATNMEEKKMTAYVFPGQGSQKVGMGKDIFKKFPDYVKKADEILGYSIEELCVQDPQSRLTNTEYTQPALYTVSALMYLEKIKETGSCPDFVAGHSLGEYSALFAAGYYDFETGLKLVQQRGAIMTRHQGGGMAAIIGLEDEQVENILKKNNFTTLDIANYNSPYQVVISGPVDDIKNTASLFSAEGVLYIPLKVSGAFHSRYMHEARNEFLKILKDVSFMAPQLTVISNVTAREYNLPDSAKLLADQICMPVQWTESIRYLKGKGVKNFIEIGPGGVLTKLIQKITSVSKPLIVNSTQPSSHAKVNSIAMAKKQVPVINENKIAKKTLKIDLKKIQSLGNMEFKQDYNLNFAYLAGGMYRGISSVELVVKMGKAKMLAFLGSYRMGIENVKQALDYIQGQLAAGEPYGCNISYSFFEPAETESLLELCISREVKVIEISGFLQLTPALIKFRLKGIKKDPNGNIIYPRRIIAKIGNPEVADLFLTPAEETIVQKLVAEGQLTPQEAAIARGIPMADDLCVLADSGGVTEGGNLITLLPVFQAKRDEFVHKYAYKQQVRVGAAGSIGTGPAVGIAFLLGADFVSTGSINMCTVEAGLNQEAKKLLQNAGVRDTELVPDFDLFELGIKSQVLKRGVFFPARANTIYTLYKQYKSLDDLGADIKKKLESKYFGSQLGEIFNEIKTSFPAEKVEKAMRDSRYKMLLIFKWYMDYTARLPVTGSATDRINFQLPCSPALGALNSFLNDSDRKPWHNRNVDELALILLNEGVNFIKKCKRFAENEYTNNS